MYMYIYICIHIIWDTIVRNTFDCDEKGLCVSNYRGSRELCGALCGRRNYDDEISA